MLASLLPSLPGPRQRGLQTTVVAAATITVRTGPALQV